MTAIPFPLRSNPAPFEFMGDARLINCFPEEIGAENESPVGFLCIPGKRAFSAFSDVPSRGAIEVAELDLFYAVHGTTAYEVDAAGDETALTGIVPGSRPVVMERGPEHFQQSAVSIAMGSPAVFGWPNHRLGAGATVQINTAGTLPTGVEASKTYFVLAAGLTANEFRLALTAGGTAIDATGTQKGVHTATRTEATYQVVIVADHDSFCIEDGHLIRIDLPEEANSVTFLDNRWVFGTDSGRFYWSDLNEATIVDALSYATAEARPDGLSRAFADRGELWLLGKKTTEIWTGDADEQFVPLSGTFIDKGCASRESVASFDNAVHWVGNDDIVYRGGSGYSAERVSTHPVERAIKAVADKTTIRAFVYTDEGHAFYVLTCPQWTWVLDRATKVWHERVSYQRANWRAWPYVAAFGKHLICDPPTGAWQELTNEVHDEMGRPIRCELTLPDVPGEVEYDMLEIGLATGVGLNVVSTAVGYDPQVMLSWSDNGRTYGNERTGSIGRNGDFDVAVRFNRLGTSKRKGRRFRIACSEPTVKAFYIVDIVATAVAA